MVIYAYRCSICYIYVCRGDHICMNVCVSLGSVYICSWMCVCSYIKRIAKRVREGKADFNRSITLDGDKRASFYYLS